VFTERKERLQDREGGAYQMAKSQMQYSFTKLAGLFKDLLDGGKRHLKVKGADLGVIKDSGGSDSSAGGHT